MDVATQAALLRLGVEREAAFHLSFHPSTQSEYKAVLAALRALGIEPGPLNHYTGHSAHLSLTGPGWVMVRWPGTQKERLQLQLKDEK